MLDENRDILIELRVDMKHVREKVDHLSNSDAKQWERLDIQGSKLEGHEKTLGFLGWAVRLLIGGLVTSVLGGIVYMVKSG